MRVVILTGDIVDAAREGRTVFANIVKIVRMGASPDFSNSFRVIGASELRRYIPALGFVPLTASYWPLLVCTVVSHLLETQLVKMWLRRRGWIGRMRGARQMRRALCTECHPSWPVSSR